MDCEGPAIPLMVLKKMCKFKDIFLPMLSFVVGDGKHIFLRHDPWHPRGPLLKCYGAAVLYGLGSSTNAKLSTMIQNGHWRWHVARSDCHKYLQSFLPSIIPTGEADEVIWLVSASRTFQTSST